MEFSAKNQEMANVFASILTIGIFEDDKALTPAQENLDIALNNLISDYLIKKEGFKGKFTDTVCIPTFLKIPADKIMLVGLGKKKDFSLAKVTEICSKLAKQYEKILNTKNVACELLGLNSKKFDAKACAKAMTEGFMIGAYDYDKYKTKKNTSEIKKIKLIAGTNQEEKEAKEGIIEAQIIGEAMNFTKDLINEPAQNATPEAISSIAKEMCEQLGVTCKVYNKKQLQEMNFNAFLAVGQGSVHEPKFIHLTYKSHNPKKKIVLIGKGITFDSGGLDIKPANSMLTMKTDMSGCATVLGVMKAIAQLKPNIELHVLSALCENMPSGSSYKQGDVLTAKNGKTIEVDNTDAEGRLTLADVLTYADELNADEVIDIATLTGAVVVALGQNITGIMGNNKTMINKLIQTGEKIGETLWELPIVDDMQEALKSDIADMRNTGSRFAGSSVAGRFLQNFTQSKNWAHIDIAGTAFIDKPYRELNKGATAAMLRTLTSYILS